jgi:hypothetical protein
MQLKQRANVQQNSFSAYSLHLRALTLLRAAMFRDRDVATLTALELEHAAQHLLDVFPTAIEGWLLAMLTLNAPAHGTIRLLRRNDVKSSLCTSSASYPCPQPDCIKRSDYSAIRSLIV